MGKDEAAKSSQATLPWETIDPEDRPLASAAPRNPAMALIKALAAAAPAETVVLERKEDGSLSVASSAKSAGANSSADSDQDDDIVSDQAPPQPIAPAPDKPDGGGWTITILCLGIGLVAACTIIPQIDANRRLAYEGRKLQMDLEQIQRQAAVNKEFLREIESDPQLAERLAQRQMRMIRKGETVLDVQGADDAGASSMQQSQSMSPFLITKVPPPPPLPAYRPLGGVLADLCLQGHTRLYILGLGLFLVAAGLVLGKTEDDAAAAGR